MKKWIFAIVLLCFAISVAAQDTPSRTLTQPTVLADLARRVGRGSMTLTDLGDWNWFFGTYNYVTGLGCIGAPTTAPAGGRWQRWELTYGSTAYIYLITDDAQTVILCNEAALTTPGAPTPIASTPQSIASATPAQGATSVAVTPLVPGVTATVGASGSLGGQNQTTPQTTCPMAARLTIGESGRVTPGDPNWVHAEANRASTKTGEIPGEGTFTVIQGPVCDGATLTNYWLVQGNGVTGWTGEGRNGEYWLEPVETIRAITRETAAQLAPASWVTGFPVPIHDVVFSPLSNYFVVVDTSGRAALYDARTQNLISELRSPGRQAYTLMRFTSNDARLATADTANNVYIWDVSNPAAVNAIAQVAVDKPMTALALSAYGGVDHLIAVATDDGQVRLWAAEVAAPQTPPLMTLTVEGAAHVLEFSFDGQMLIARDATGKMLALWEVGE